MSSGLSGRSKARFTYGLVWAAAHGPKIRGAPRLEGPPSSNFLLGGTNIRNEGSPNYIRPGAS